VLSIIPTRAELFCSKVKGLCFPPIIPHCAEGVSPKTHDRHSESVRAKLFCSKIWSFCFPLTLSFLAQSYPSKKFKKKFTTTFHANDLIGNPLTIKI
jgi:hypothetical protein